MLRFAFFARWAARLFDVADHQPQRFLRRGIVRELAPVAGSFTQFIVE